MKKKKIGIAGCTGHVVKFGKLVNSFEESETVAVWDYDVERGKQVACELGVPFVNSYDELLVNYGLDGVLIISDNSYKAELCIKAADHGISIFVEKPMCVNLEEAYAIRDAVKRNNVKFFMTDPFVRRGIMKAKELISDGKLGTITEATIRISQERPHFEQQFSPETSQGGIMADVGGHAIHIAHYLFGKPEKISSVLTYNTPYARKNRLETNARVVMLYPDDLLVTMECSFVSRGLETMTIVHGTTASAYITPDSSNKPGEEQVVIITDRTNRETLTDLPQPATGHIRYFIEMLVKDIPNDMIGIDPSSNSGVSIDNAVEFVEIINAIYKSANNGLTEL